MCARGWVEASFRRCQVRVLGAVGVALSVEGSLEGRR
jgi:hypothetical protein